MAHKTLLYYYVAIPVVVNIEFFNQFVQKAAAQSGGKSVAVELVK